MVRARFRYVPHTADMAYVAYGNSFGEAIENAAGALLSIILDVKKLEKARGKVRRIDIRETAESIEDLAWFVLQDILSKREIGGLNAFAFKVGKFSHNGKFSMRGELICKETTGDFLLMEVKAVTPHGLEVNERKGTFSVKVVVDI